MREGPGHLLVLLGDLTELACHAVVVPTSRELEVAEPWKDLVPLKRQAPNSSGWYSADLVAPAGWGDADRALQAPDVDGRQVWLVRTDAWLKDGAWVADGLVQAVERAAGLLPPPVDRARALIGVPLAGTGAGGLRSRRGEVVSAAVPALEDAAHRSGVDVALVLRDRQDHAAVQAMRSTGGGPGRRMLDDRELGRADALGRLAADDHLVLFLGAGVSLAAGLPTWSGLLRELIVTTELGHLGLESLAPPDAAQILKDELGDDRFAALMKERFTLTRYTVTHALSAGLQAEAVVTTNYDNGYELAAASCGSAAGLKVLPREHAEPGAPWLLKMHGDVARPDSIVLTRQHYLEYADGRAPLTGMVQALLMTRHMLFVGFSLVDDNFARLAHQVRRVLSTAEPLDRKVGTVLALHADPARERLWRNELDQVPMAPASSPEGEAGSHEAARRLELFLDHVAWRAETARGGSEVHLLDRRYDALQRSEPEEALRKVLRDLQKSVSDKSKATSAWAVVERALKALGDGL